MLIKKLSYLLIIVWAFSTAGCALFTKPQPTPVVVHRSPEDILAALEQNPNSFPTFRAGVTARITFPFEGKEKKHSFDGALLYNDKNQAMRFQGFGIFGQTYFDILYQPNKMRLYLPSSSEGFYGDPSQLPRESDAGVFLILQKTIEGIEMPLDRGDVHFSKDICAPVVVDQGNGYSVVKVNPQTLLIDERIIFRDEELVGVVRYDDYAHIDGLLLPQNIEVALPQKGLSFTLDFDSLSLNEKLPKNLFQLTVPKGIPWYPLTALQIDFLL